ncbi:unnamed protein product [Anisakis simplex]|uniref:Mediator of RNA polymerase II transcription subunit 23 n=1 Tax=Anisakis simplex TaxID=6269 RepID=A0A3P6QI68_ANISI|nr:unnamed protein product [Anisakis simplex]
MFWDLSGNVDVDELTCGEAINVLRSMNEEEKSHCCKATLNALLNKDNPRYVQLERVLSSIFIAACNEGVLSLSECCELLILCTDFTLSTPIDARKFEYMQRNLHLIDYKGLRNILKLLVVERMQEVPSTITNHQRHMLLPVENMLLTLIDRQLNLLPCLFTITELHRVSSNSRAFLLPRVAKKFNETFISFRPLTEMVTVIGRPWLYPIASHISFPVSTSSWKLEVATTKLHQRAHLPYKSELFAPQSSLLYTLLRQPRGKDTLSYVLRQNTNMTPQRIQCDELLHMIILEAMSEMEKTDTRLDDAANQYQWMNITQTVTFSLLHGMASFSRLLKILYESLSETVYRKGRDELMWVILQYVAVYIGKVSNEDMIRIADIYNLLYSDEQCWSGADTDPLLFVRFFVPAAIWIHFYKKPNSQASEVLPKPSESLLRQIQFLQEKTSDSDPAIQNVADHNAVLAAVANAYSNDMQNFHKLVLTAVDMFLDGIGEDATGSLWRLPHGIICLPKKTPLPLPLIDSLTFHSRNHLFQMCLHKLSTMLNVQQSAKLPSPASIDTLVRLASTTEFEYGVKLVLTLMPRALASISANANIGATNQPDRSRDLLYILCDMLSYRLINYPLPVIPKVNVILSCYSALSNNQVQMNVALYSALEQVMLRYWMWNSPQEMIVLCNALIGKQGKLTALISSPNSFGEPQHGSSISHERPSHANLHVSPEMLRSLLLSMFRALKLTGVEMASEVLQRCNANFSWPLSVSRTFSTQLMGCSIDDGSEVAPNEELFHCVDQDHRRTHEYLCTQSEESLIKYFTIERRHTLFCVIYNHLIYDSKKLHPVFYSMLNSMTAKDIIVMVNKFVDYFIYIFKKNPPSDDQTFTTVSSFSDVRNRLGFLFHFIPSNKIVNTNSSFFNKMSEYYSQYPELTYREMEVKLRREMQLELQLRQMEQPVINPELHMPIYYGNLAERILPVVDILLQRALELAVADQLFNPLLKSFKPCYKYHPQPAAYMYNVLYCLDNTLSHTAKARLFVSEICGQLEERDGKYALLTPSFIQDNHQLSLPSQFCQVLVDRILQASHYPHQPPPFVYRDWRFAELAPAGQALTGACIELLASPHDPSVTARALIDLVFIRPLHQPYATINTVALILTALPSSFQRIFYDHIVSVLDSEALTQGDPSVCFESLESECFLLTENQLLTNLALGHAYLQHCNTSSLAALPEFVRDKLAPKLVTEAQLIFVLRLVVPILQRFYDMKERSKQIQDLAVDVYKMTVKVNERVGVLKYEDAICDLLYHMKYMYVGDFVKNEAEQAIQRLSPSMRVKLNEFPIPKKGHLLQCSWYWGNMSWLEAEKVLMTYPLGTYLIRDSASDRYIFTISYKTTDSVHHTRLPQHGGKFCLGGPNSLVRSESLMAFVETLEGCDERGVCLLMHQKGEKSEHCLQRLTKRDKFKARQLFYSRLHDSNGALIDRAMAVFLPGPSTFTGEDTAEIYVHGSRAVVNCVCDTLSCIDNVQAAKAGEFTKRAFFNSKLTLDDVLSLSYLLSAETQRQRALALHSTQIGSVMPDVRTSLIELICSLEAGIDFADDVTFDWDLFRSHLRDIISQLQTINRRAQRGSLITDGISVVMLGKTNVGKSSLLNRIAERDVAIVSDVEGTTRDALETRIELSSVPVIFTDTAGIRIAQDFLEAEGISRTIARAKQAHLLLAVIDGSKNADITTEVNELLKRCHCEDKSNIVVACNKADLIKQTFEQSYLLSLKWKVVLTSCLNTSGIDQLVINMLSLFFILWYSLSNSFSNLFSLSTTSCSKYVAVELDVIKEHISEICPEEGNDALLSRYRQRILLNDAISVLQKVEGNRDSALIAEYLREASDLIGEISGTIVNEEILDRIFSSFCIGK